MWPWLDRSGRFSWLKACTLLAALVPAAWLLADWQGGRLGAEPIREAIHVAGDWAIRFLVLTLAVTPLRRVGGWPRLILVRRMLGLTALGYALLHFTLYLASVQFDLARAGTEILLRVYLTIGFGALLVLLLLGATSTDRAIRRLGRSWQPLHRWLYPAAAVGILHYFLQSKADVSQPVLIAGLFVWLMAFRWLDRLAGARPSPWRVAPLTLFVPLATALLEAGWYSGMTGINPSRVLLANLSLAVGLRPAAWVLLFGMALLGIALMRPLWDRRRRIGQERTQGRAAGRLAPGLP
jgi:sulfoxide reductase heme-binding subunit YedZ